MTIPTLSPTPVRGDPDTFSTAFETFLTGLDPWAVAVQAVGDAADADATAAAASAVTAMTQVGLATIQVGLATAQAVLAEASADAAAGSALVAGAVAWVSGTTYAIGDCRYSPINLQTYRRRTDGAGTIDPSADSTNWAKAIEAGISNVVTATGSTTLTSTPTLLQITPASYGIAVTLPDATTCNLGGPLHIIDKRGAYPVKVLNSAGTLLGFIFAGVVSHVSLIDNSTEAGVWTIENNELVGASAQLLTSNLVNIKACVDLGSGKEMVVATDGGGAPKVYAVVYDKTTNTFGSVTLIRSIAGGSDPYVSACLSSAGKVLVCSAPTNATGFEAVVLSVSGTTITVNTAATATLSANMSAFADGCGLIAVGSSFVCSYTVATPAAQIRALSISGTTVTIGSATVLDGTAGGLIALGDSTHVIAASTATTHLYTKPYLVSGSTLTAGTGTDTNSGTMTLNKLAALGTRWYVGYNDGGTTVKGGVVSLTATGNGTTTISTATLFSAGALQDAIIVGSDKVLALNNHTTNNANILTDTAGTASAGTAIKLSSETSRACLYVSGTNVVVGETSQRFHLVSCSGSSPVKAQSWQHLYNAVYALYATSNAVLSRTAEMIFGTTFAQGMPQASSTASSSLRFSGAPSLATLYGSQGAGRINYSGKSDSERWVSDGATVITKIECAA